VFLAWQLRDKGEIFEDPEVLELKTLTGCQTGRAGWGGNCLSGPLLHPS
jgi:hypothetical protein